jgi:hypothetical protein
MRRRRGAVAVTVAAAALVVLVAAGAATALVTPGRSKVRSGPVSLVALDDYTLAFAVGRSQADCDHVELWDTASRGLWRFGRPGPCTNLGSTGAGISALGVSGNRVLFVKYNGGNERDWQLMTATTTLRTPRQLRFVPQDVELPSPFVIGDSTGGVGIPYATGREVILLGSNGARVFRHVAAAPVVALSAGFGPGATTVAALTSSGSVEMLKQNGSVGWTADFDPGAVKAIALAPSGLIAQVGDSIEVRTPVGKVRTTPLPAGAAMLDFAEGRVLYRLGNEIHARGIVGGHDTLLLRGAAAKPPLVATLDSHGLAWARGRSVSYTCGSCIPFTG